MEFSFDLISFILGGGAVLVFKALFGGGGD